MYLSRLTISIFVSQGEIIPDTRLLLPHGQHFYHIVDPSIQGGVDVDVVGDGVVVGVQTSHQAERHGARVRRDPNDGRRAMISGRCADVCAALDRMVATDTIEEKVTALKARKAELFAKVVDGGGATSTGITADDIRGLFED